MRLNFLTDARNLAQLLGALLAGSPDPVMRRRAEALQIDASRAEGTTLSLTCHAGATGRNAHAALVRHAEGSSQAELHEQLKSYDRAAFGYDPSPLTFDLADFPEVVDIRGARAGRPLRGKPPRSVLAGTQVESPQDALARISRILDGTTDPAAQHALQVARDAMEPAGQLPPVPKSQYVFPAPARSQ